MKVMTTTVDEVSTGDRVQDDSMAVDEAIALADTLLREALANSTRRERRQLHRLGRLVADPERSRNGAAADRRGVADSVEPPRCRAGLPTSSTNMGSLVR